MSHNLWLIIYEIQILSQGANDGRFVIYMSIGHKASLFLNFSIEYDDCSTPGRPRC